MPVFVYKCDACGREFEELVLSSADAEAPKCPACGSEKVKRMFSSFSVNVKSGSSCPTGTCGL